MDNTPKLFVTAWYLIWSILELHYNFTMWEFTIILKYILTKLWKFVSLILFPYRVYPHAVATLHKESSGANLKRKKLGTRWNYEDLLPAVYPKSLQMVCLFECGPFGRRNHPEETRRPRFLFGSSVNNNFRRNIEEYYYPSIVFPLLEQFPFPFRSFNVIQTRVTFVKCKMHVRCRSIFV